MKVGAWFAGLADRERRLVLWGGGAAAVLVLAAIIIQLGSSVAAAEERVERRRQDLAWIEAVTPRLQAAPAARPGEPLAIADRKSVV